MFQKSLLKNFRKSFKHPEASTLINFTNKDKFVTEYVNGMELKEEIEKLEGLVETSVATIDQIVYELYGLSESEVALVEGNK